MLTISQRRPAVSDKPREQEPFRRGYERKPPRSTVFWSQDQDAILTELWNAGLPTQEIGVRMGVSKNAAIGRARRIKLPRRANPAT